MSAQPDLCDVQSWSGQLGLMPVPLLPHPQRTAQFILLNGSRGSFCLDVGRSPTQDDPRSVAWSSNVGHYVMVDDDQVLVQRWDRRAGAERYTSRSVSDNLQRFHEYLEADAPRPELSVISHAIDVFRTLRALAAGALDGGASLKAYLCLLACTLKRSTPRELDLAGWQLGADAIDAASQIAEPDWLALQEKLAGGRPLQGLVARLELLLRHASGELFQEAHYEAVFPVPSQPTLRGFLPAPARVTRSPRTVGVYYTPPALVRTVVQESLASLGEPTEPLAVFDPACGSGEFLREAVRQLRLRGYTDRIRLIGWDASEPACQMARFALAWELRDDLGRVDVDVQCVDSVKHAHDWPQQVDLLLMNPPFQSWADMDKEQQQAVSEVLGTAARRRPDLSHAFLLNACASLRDGAVLGAVIPASLFDSYSARALRGELSHVLAPRLIARLGSHVLFPGAVVDAGLYVAKKGSPTQPTLAFWADYRSTSTAAGLRALRKSRQMGPVAARLIEVPGLSIYPHEVLGRGEESWAPRPYRSRMLFRRLGHLPRVADLFDVRQGALTGCNRAFLLPKAAWLALPPAERDFFRPAVINSSIRNGFLAHATYVFYPYEGMTIASEENLTRCLPQYYRDHLLPAKAMLLARSDANQDRWWELTWPRAWQLTPNAKLVSTYFGDAGSFAFDDNGDFVVVHGYSWQPRRVSARAASWRATALAYLAVLTSGTFSELLSFASNHVRGGQWNLSRRFVVQIPIPDLFNERAAPAETAELSRVGEEILRGEPVTDAELDGLVAAVYGLDMVV